jgi:macrolide phosphotransferase
MHDLPDDLSGSSFRTFRRGRHPRAGASPWLGTCVVTAADPRGQSWVLRIPRRADVIPKIEREARVLAFLRSRLPFAVPDWRIVSPDLVAYPRLPGATAIRVDAATKEVSWNIHRDGEAFSIALGQALAALHTVPVEAAATAGIRMSSPEAVRAQTAHELDRVKAAFELDPDLERRWRSWLEDETAWPPHSVVVHGDLYAGYVLVGERADIIGMIDWSEAEVGDPAIDFSSHLLMFGEAGVHRLIQHYATAGGRVWPGLARQAGERLAYSIVKYALVALDTREEEHPAAARARLRPG